MKKTHSEIKTKEVIILDSYTCDKCGTDLIKEIDGWNAYSVDWFKMKTGMDYGDGGRGINYKLDLCEECAKKLLSLLILNDYKIYEEEWER